jgi:hypothetical protein
VDFLPYGPHFDGHDRKYRRDESHHFEPPDRPTGISAMIAALLRAGWTMKQICASFPWLFADGVSHFEPGG